MIPGNIFSISHKACDLIAQFVAGKKFSDYNTIRCSGPVSNASSRSLAKH
jgi:hypothetical protein